MGNVMSRELIMKEYIEAVRTNYDYILIDCMPKPGTNDNQCTGSSGLRVDSCTGGLPSGERSSAADTYDCNGEETAEQAARI